MNSYRIILKNMRVQARIGIHRHEKVAPQPICVSVSLTAPIERPRAVRSLADTVDYDPIREFVSELARREHTALIEELLDDLVEVCFRNERVTHVVASIRKLEIFEDTEEAGVEISMSRACWRGDCT